MTNSTRNASLIRSTYEGTSDENGRRLQALLAPDVAWTEAEGFPYAGTYHGPEHVKAGVFARLGSEWEGYRANLEELHDAGDVIVACGVYEGTFRRTGRSMRAAFAHIWTLRDGSIVRFVQHVDSAKVLEAMR